MCSRLHSDLRVANVRKEIIRRMRSVNELDNRRVYTRIEDEDLEPPRKVYITEPPSNYAGPKVSLKSFLGDKFIKLNKKNSPEENNQSKTNTEQPRITGISSVIPFPTNNSLSKYCIQSEPDDIRKRFRDSSYTTFLDQPTALRKRVDLPAVSTETLDLLICNSCQGIPIKIARSILHRKPF